MRKKKFLFILALLCAIVQGTWAQANWDAVYAMTQTTAANWTALTGSTTGKTLGTAGTTTYYYANSNLSFTNSTAGGSGLTIKGTVYLYVPSGVIHWHHQPHPDPSPKGEGSSYWYTLDGRRLNGQPTRAGVYINNGVKVAIK